MSVKKLSTVLFDGKEILAQLMSKRNLTNRRMAKILGVEPWTIGAWLSGKREISSKYEEKVKELYQLPDDADLLVMPVASELSKRIREIDDIADLSGAVLSLQQVMRQVGIKLGEFTPYRLDTVFLEKFSKFLCSLDIYSIAKLNEFVSRQLIERTYINGLSNVEYCDLVIKYADNEKVCNISFERDEEELRVDCSAWFDEVYERSLYFDDDIKEPIDMADVKKNFEDNSRSEHKKLFTDTCFVDDWLNHQWVSEDTYISCFKIPLDHPVLKESLRIVLNRRVTNSPCFSLNKEYK